MDNTELWYNGKRRVWVEGNSLVFNQDGHEIRINGDNTITCDGKEVYRIPHETNLQRIKGMNTKDLASMLVTYDYGWKCYSTSDEKHFELRENAVQHEIDWLNSEYDQKRYFKIYQGCNNR